MFFKKKEKHLSFDRSRQIPVIRPDLYGRKDCRIQGHGYRKFEDICCIRSDRDLEEFMKTYESPGGDQDRILRQRRIHIC